MVELKIYFTGRDMDVDFMLWVNKIEDEILNQIEKLKFCVLDSSQKYLNFNLGFENAKLNHARNCYMILKSDLVLINFDKISNLINFSEVFIAQGFNKPIIGFSSSQNSVKNDSIKGLVTYFCQSFDDIKSVLEGIKLDISKINEINSDDLINYYLDNFYQFDSYVNERI